MWFIQRDANQDGQVSMAEYASRWTESLVAEFNRFDANRDGLIEPKECLAAVGGSGAASGRSAGGLSPKPAPTRPGTDAAPPDRGPQAGSAPSPGLPGGEGPPE
ncbi:MAG: hypothetical protein ACUVUC_13865 [Thermoguttaceae bacterium]